MTFDSLALALAYLDRHFYTRYIFPIKAGAKFPPLVQDNLATNASNDPKRIIEWSKKWPGCNWGVAHRASRLLVVDVDCNQTKSKVGQQTFDALALAYDWPDTERTETPSGGFHLIYEGWAGPDHPEHIMALGENGIGKDIDSPNYTLIAGCTFADDTSYVGNDAPAVRCPAWIYDVIKSAKSRARISNAGEVVVDYDKPANIETAIDFLKNDAQPAIEGQAGDFTTLKTAMYLKDLGISPGLAVDLLTEYYNPRCQPPWERADLERKVENAFAYSSLSKIGGKTAEADFADDPPPPITPMGKKKTIQQQKKERAQAKAREAAIAPADRERILKRQEVVEEWVWITGIERFIEKSNLKAMWKRSAFDAHFAHIPGKSAPKSFSECLFREKKNTIARFKDIAYKPGLPQRINGEIFNMYVPSDVVPMQGDVSWWDDHVAYLFPDEADRNLVLDWMAWLLQNIAMKPKHALLIQGEDQGTGKSYLAEMLARILGTRNVANISQTDLHGDFNGWAQRSKLIVIEELRAIDKAEVANKLHPLITQEVISVNEKNLPQRDVENCFGVFSMSNHEAALNLDPTDRRYLVINTKATPRYGKGSPESVAYYTDLYVRRLNDPASVAAVAFSLMNRALGEYSGAAAAPLTAAKTAMIKAGQSDLAHFMDDHRYEFPLSGRLITVEDVITVLPKRLETRSPRLHSTIKTVLIREFGGEELGQAILANGTRPRLYAINGKGGILRNLDMRALGAIYESDKVKAGKGQDIDDASTEFEVDAGTDTE